MGFGRTAPTADHTFQVICRNDNAIRPVEVPFEQVLADVLKEEPRYEVREGESTEETRTRYIADLQAWEKKKVAAVTAFFLPTPEAKVLGVTERDLRDLRTELEACTFVTGAMEKGRWHRYYEHGDESVLMPWVDGEEPVRFTVHNLTNPQRVYVTGKVEEGAPKGKTAYEFTYELNVWILERTLVDVQTWPADWPAMKMDGTHVHPESIRLLPPDWAISLGSFLMKATELRKHEKKA